MLETRRKMSDQEKGETSALQGSSTPIRLRREQSHPVATLEGSEDSSQQPKASLLRRSRPRSASYVALRSAVYQLTCLNDFNREKIGSGFFADVYKVKHKTTGEVMVLKMNKCRTNSRKMLSEIQLMNRLSHPNILKFRGSCVHEGQLHCLTEYINGGSLGSWLHNTNIELSWSQRVKIAMDIARGMAYLHSKGVFHRDLNSSNCLIHKHPAGHLRTVVADFGLAAKIKQRRRRSHTEIVGSPYWMAPECLHGQSYCEQADVFSFGITLAEIVARVSADPEYMPRTKQFGMDCDTLREMCPDCPDELFDLMQRCCQLDPDDRPTFEEIVKTLESIQLDDDYHKIPNVEAVTQEAHEKHHTVAQSPTGDAIDLRSCISEPFLQLEDSLEDLTTSSEILLHSRQDSISSLTTSTEPSSSGSSGSDHRIVEEDEYEFSLIEPSGNAVPPLVSRGLPPFAREERRELEQSESWKTACSEAAQHPDSSNVVVEESGLPSLAVQEEGHTAYDAETIARRNSEGDLKLNNLLSSNQDSKDTGSNLRLGRKLRYPLLKSISLNTANEQKSPLLSSGKLGHLTSNIINSSMQTLVGDDCNDIKTDNTGGGGDSGIDPGVAEVFKFPPSKSEACDKEVDWSSSTSVQHTTPSVRTIVGESFMHNGDGGAFTEEGDLTPICTSPTLVSLAKPVIPYSSLGNSLINGTMPAHTLLKEKEEVTLTNSHHFNSVETTPSGSHVYDSFVTPNYRCSSPNAQSCASSEFSFRLPSPSFPWAPPTSPTNIHKQSRSLPTTPTHNRPPRSQNHFRYSQEITNHMYSTVYPMNYTYDDRLSDSDDLHIDSAKAYYRTQDLSERDIDDRFMEDPVHVRAKMVHFLDVDNDLELCKRLDEDFSNTSLSDSYQVYHRRSRSHSNPARAVRKHSSGNHYSLTYATSPPTTSHEMELDHCGISPHPCVSRYSTQQLKCYNIRLRRNVRLSNSAPNLPSLSSLRSVPCL